MSSCNHDCNNCSSKCSNPSDFRVTPHEKSNIKKVIGIVSGKGGVGKSLVTSLMACAMNRKGYHVGILDADITGPSIPKCFGVHEISGATEEGMYPAKSATGIEVMSINLLLEEETMPVVWRGPVIAGAVKQFWTDVIWQDVDFMFVDMPPGTGDVPLTVFQSIPVDGIIVVTSPQELVSMIVKKALNMANLMNIPVLGLVENMSYFKCPDCNQEHKIYGESHIDEIAAENGLDVLGKLPIDSAIAAACDGGRIEAVEGIWLEKAVEKLETL